MDYLHELIVWVIMNHEVEDSKTNAYKVPPYASQQWQKMISLGKYTIKDILKDEASDEESHPPSPGVAKKGRNRKNLQGKSKVIVYSEESDTMDDKPTKSVGCKVVKYSSKPNKGSQSSKTKQNSIVKGNSLLMPKIVESRQTEFDEHHHPKISGVTDILQASV